MIMCVCVCVCAVRDATHHGYTVSQHKQSFSYRSRTKFLTISQLLLDNKFKENVVNLKQDTVE
jgi:hypothetical protein